MKKIIFLILLLALWLPQLQSYFMFINLKPLNGEIIAKDKPAFNFTQWWDGEFQNNFNIYIDETPGLKNFFIRLYNQADYSFYKKIHAYVTIGQKGYLFEQGYIDEKSGFNFIGNDSINFKIKNIRNVQNYLDNKNISLITVLAPSKADYYEEYLPQNYLPNNSTPRNYTSLLKYAKEENIRLIDFNKWFLQLKDTSRYPLFPKQGIHWNYYGMALCADSITKYIEASKMVSLPEISWTLELPNTLRGTDYDLAGLFNIFQQLPFDKMPYPEFTIKRDSSNSNIRLLVVADSFYWTIFGQSVFSKTFDNETYYYYTRIIYPDGKARSTNPHDLNILKEVEKYDVVLLLQSSSNYSNPGVGFIQLLTSEIKNRNEYLIAAETLINENPVLLNRAKELVSEYKITNDSAKYILADSIAESKIQYISDVKIQMRNSPEWLKQLNEKKVQQNKSLDEIMETDAEWVYDNQNK